MTGKAVRVATIHFFCWIGLMAVVCIPSFIAGVTYTKPSRPVALLNASVAGLDGALSNTAAPDRAEQPGRRQTAEVLDRGGAVKAYPLDTSFDSRREALE